MAKRAGRRPFLLAGAAVLVLLGIHSEPVQAGGRSGSQGGALGQVTSSVRQATSPPAQPASSAPSPSTSSSDVVRSYSYYEPDYRTTSGAHYGAGGYCSACAPGPGQTGLAGERPRVALSLGVQSVKDSDGAAMGSLRVTKGMLGADISGTRYFEEAPAMDGTNTIYMNVWALSALARVVRTGATEMWISGGVGETSSNQFESLMGPVLGASIEHVLTPSLTVSAAARYYILEQDMRAGEVRAGVTASVLSVGYRVFRFNVGPALRGPEVGVNLRF